VICSRNRPTLLEDVVASVLAGDERPAELVVVDQSVRSNAALARVEPGGGCVLRYLWSRSTGLSRANNEGAAAAGHELLLFTHDDVLVAPNWFGTLARRAAQHGPRTVVTGRVLAGGAEAPGAFAPSTQSNPVPAIFSGRRCDGVLFPQNMAIHRSVLADIGAFDPRIGPGTPFPAAEDNDFCWRLLEAAYQIVYAPEAIVYHRAWRRSTAYASLRWDYGRGQGAFYAKHLDARDRFVWNCMLGSLQAHVSRAARGLRRDPALALGEVAYTLGVLTGAAQWALTFRGTRWLTTTRWPPGPPL
jgi:GT2 family glycosyltransferase